MNLNNLLCEHFEKDQDGNVKIRNILNGIFKIIDIPIIFIPITFSIIISMIRAFPGISNDISPYMTLERIMSFYIESLIELYIVIGIILILIKIWNLILNINVAKCPKM